MQKKKKNQFRGAVKVGESSFPKKAPFKRFKSHYEESLVPICVERHITISSPKTILTSLTEVIL